MDELEGAAKGKGGKFRLLAADKPRGPGVTNTLPFSFVLHTPNPIDRLFGQCRSRDH